MASDTTPLAQKWLAVVDFLATIHTQRLPEKLVKTATRDDEDRLEHVNNNEGGDKSKDPLVITVTWYGKAYASLLLAIECAKQYTTLIEWEASNADRFIKLAAGAADWFNTKHEFVRGIMSPRASALIVQVVSASWRCLMQSLLLLRALEACRDDGGQYDGLTLLLTERANEMTYPQALVHAQRGNIIVSTDEIAHYSVNEWSVAFEALMDSIYQTTGWTVGARRYLNALVARYAVLLRGDAADIAKGRACYDNGTLCIRPPGLANRLLPLPGLLGDGFVVEMERKLFHAMRHSTAANGFYRRGKLVRRSVVWRRRALAALVSYVVTIDKDRTVHIALVEAVRNALMGREILPGEFEQSLYMGQGAGSINTSTARGEPDMVLFDLRRDEFMALQPLQTASMAELCNLWVSSYYLEEEVEGVNDDAWWEAVACRRAKRERLALLILQHALDLRFPFSRHGYFDDSSADPPYDAPPRTPMDALGLFEGRLPIFVAISHLYAVIDDAQNDREEDAMDIDEQPTTTTTNYITYVTPHLPDAIALWIERAIANRCVELDQVHSALLPLLEDDFVS
jgi:hypothetical protein